MHILTKNRGWVQLCPTTVNSNQPPDKTLLDELGLEPDPFPNAVADQYCRAVRGLMNGQIGKDLAKDMMGAKNYEPKWAKYTWSIVGEHKRIE